MSKKNSTPDELLWRQLKRLGEIENGDAPTVENEFDLLEQADSVFLEHLLRAKAAPRVNRVVNAKLAEIRADTNMVPEEYRAEYDAAREALATSGILAGIVPDAKKKKTVAALARAKKHRVDRALKKKETKTGSLDMKEAMKLSESNAKMPKKTKRQEKKFNKRQ